MDVFIALVTLEPSSIISNVKIPFMLFTKVPFSFDIRIKTVGGFIQLIRVINCSYIKTPIFHEAMPPDMNVIPFYIYKGKNEGKM